MAAITFFDTETTGLPVWSGGAGHPNQPHIMQLGAILQDAESRRVVMEVNLLFQLPDNVTPAEEAVSVHKITPGMCRDFGVKNETALRIFDLMLKKSEIVVAHNLNFDALMYEAAVLRQPDLLSMESFRGCRPFCTMMNSTMICKVPNPKRPGSYKWPTLKEAHSYFFPQVPWNEEGAHDAMYDVRECQAIYWALQDRLRQL